MTEVEMFQVVKSWLEANEYEVYAEVRYKRHDIDVVGAKPGRQICVELKTSFTQGLRRQLLKCKRATRWVYAGVGTTPRKENFQWCRERGIGILKVAGCKAEVLLDPRQVRKSKPTWINLRRARKDNVGGAPCGAKKHPALDAYHAIKAYMAGHPDADWNEVFDSVPNHYAHARSMQSSMERYVMFKGLEPLTPKGNGRRGRKRKKGGKRWRSR